MKDLLEAGHVVPVIDRRYPFRDVAEALRYLEAGTLAEKSSSPWTIPAGEVAPWAI